ncbi:hypothetical protein Kpol_1023p24 [Vanderwaltozyma polyspora DSM 70294]|uniref:Sorting nexin MVP1 n=1 Tax=Vanderwaltozyma polyspora (strain ATCC 22028 / DSM 70294 / BCRC 21397 / CBS 2163 / NBRC 10782 / NRRL Y-8283 / UCD 57-17) TaxID=436907 RepID=A7TFP7_VANPO|nr:uncharacterized protein Kpol_1023p24 [Vanderwaltozyma polyspora DSM 70294]EDO18855.1 hypothetical protein Kpol_1023p24 [Vanderwaltozyma polyspora DSM 70294]
MSLDESQRAWSSGHIDSINDKAAWPVDSNVDPYAASENPVINVIGLSEDLESQPSYKAIKDGNEAEGHDSIWAQRRNNLNTDRLRTSILVETNADLRDGIDEEPIIRNAVFKDSSFEAWSSKLKKTYNPLSPDIVVINEIDELEGIIFKHTNYRVKHLVELPNTDPADDHIVIRRYSDFIWLRKVLLKKYPLRLIPDLPPKKLGSQYSSRSFLLARRQGLIRFINLVMKHPVLKNDDLVLTFLTVPAELSSWRNQASYDTSEEFADKRISETFKQMWDPRLLEKWNKINASLDKSMIIWNNMRILVERYESRMLHIAQERDVFKACIETYSQHTNVLYPEEHSASVIELNDHLKVVEKHLENTTELINNEAEELHSSLVPKFVTYIEVLKALQKLFERYRILSRNTVHQLERRVELNEERLEAMKGKPDISGAEYDKIVNIVQQDKRSINQQINRSWLIKECVLEEFTFFQKTQFLAIDTLQTWTAMHSKYYGFQLNEWERLAVSLTELPSVQ